MSRTYKDFKKSKVAELKSKSQKETRPLLQHYLNFKRRGVNEVGDNCPDCGGYTDLQSGFLICTECGWIDAGDSAFDGEIAI